MFQATKRMDEVQQFRQKLDKLDALEKPNHQLLKIVTCTIVVATILYSVFKRENKNDDPLFQPL